MASTITLAGDYLTSLGNRRQTQGTGNLGVYATAGVDVTANQLGLGLTEAVAVYPAAGYVFEYIPSTAKIKAYVQDGTNTDPLVEVSTSTNLSSITFVWVALGR